MVKTLTLFVMHNDRQNIFFKLDAIHMLSWAESYHATVSRINHHNHVNLSKKKVHFILFYQGEACTYTKWYLTMALLVVYNTLFGSTTFVMADLYFEKKKYQNLCIEYKDGRIEKNLLRELNIPSVNLEDLGCTPLEQINFSPSSTIWRHVKTHRTESQSSLYESGSGGKWCLRGGVIKNLPPGDSTRFDSHPDAKSRNALDATCDWTMTFLRAEDHTYKKRIKPHQLLEVNMHV